MVGIFTLFLKKHCAKGHAAAEKMIFTLFLKKHCAKLKHLRWLVKMIFTLFLKKHCAKGHAAAEKARCT